MSNFYNEIGTEDILFILGHPWKLTESEWKLQDKYMFEHTLSDIYNRLKLSVADGYTRLWKTSDGEPIAILGCYKVADAIYETFFIGSHHMEAHALKLSFEMRNLLREKAPGYKGCTCRLYSTSDHPSQMTWFRFLGFRYLPEGDLGTTRYFEYKSPSS
ncbi:MAG: hypothetical protein R2797_10575 [Gelidibacter sp.]